MNKARSFKLIGLLFGASFCYEFYNLLFYSQYFSIDGLLFWFTGACTSFWIARSWQLSSRENSQKMVGLLFISGAYGFLWLGHFFGIVFVEATWKDGQVHLLSMDEWVSLAWMYALFAVPGLLLFIISVFVGIRFFRNETT